MNTRICYLYRDACNYKYTYEIVVRGRLTWDEIVLYLDDSGFIPYDVNLPHPGVQAEGWPDEDNDHPWCELERDMIVETDVEPTTEVMASALLDAFRKAHGAGWPGQGRPY